jgi:hypothetical protein
MAESSLIHPAAILLSDPSPCLRYLVLRELLRLPEDHPEVIELVRQRLQDPLILGLTALQLPDGSWESSDTPGSAPRSRIQTTAQALLRLGYLGFEAGFPAVDRGAGFLFSMQREDGAWPLPDRAQPDPEIKGYSMIPLQTSLPLRSLAACGYATDPRCEKAYGWLLAERLEDGAWPTGLSSGVRGGVAGYRRLPHSRWGCRSNTTGALLCLALHPDRSRGPEAQRAVDLLLGRETREGHILGYEVARTIGAEPAHGFLTYFARFDLALILNLCARIGVSGDDLRLADLVEFIRSLQGRYGLWEYLPRPQVSRWLTFDILRSLSYLDESGCWLNLEPRTPFKSYLRKPKRF